MTFQRTGYLKHVAMTSLLAGLFVHAPVASANKTICDGVIIGETLDNVVVPTGAACTLSNVLIDGNLEAKKAGELTITQSRVRGNVKVKRSMGNIDIRRVQIDGNVRIEQATSTFIRLALSNVGGNVAVKNNTATGEFPPPPSGSIFIVDNVIHGNLKVSGNEGPGLVQVGSCQSGGNTVHGNVIMQHNIAGTAASVNCSNVTGNLLVQDNVAIGGNFDRDEDIQVNGNIVGGNISVRGNTADDRISVGATEPDPNQEVIFGNIVDGNLRCSDNDPDPTSESFPPPGEPFDPVEDGNIVVGSLDCAD